MFDIETRKYVKFEGGKASLQAEVYELKFHGKKGDSAKENPDEEGTLDRVTRE